MEEQCLEVRPLSMAWPSSLTPLTTINKLEGIISIFVYNIMQEMLLI